MIDFTSSSTIREVTESFSLALKSVHHFSTPISGSNLPTGSIHKGSLVPSVVDILPASSIVFSLSATTQRIPVTNVDLLHSAATRHLVATLQQNARALGITHVSQPFIDEDDSLIKFALSSAQCADPCRSPVHAVLTRIHISLSYKELVKTDDSQLSLNPFASHAYLPLSTTLHRIIRRFILYHVVRRYPLIFGPWAKTVDAETSYLRPLCQSIVNIIRRSSEPAFQQECQSLLRRLQHSHTRATLSASHLLHGYLAVSTPTPLDREAQRTGHTPDADLLEAILLRLLKRASQSSRAKAIPTLLPEYFGYDVSDATWDPSQHMERPTISPQHNNDVGTNVTHSVEDDDLLDFGDHDEALPRMGTNLVSNIIFRTGAAETITARFSGNLLNRWQQDALDDAGLCMDSSLVFFPQDSPEIDDDTLIDWLD